MSIPANLLSALGPECEPYERRNRKQGRNQKILPLEDELIPGIHTLSDQTIPLDIALIEYSGSRDSLIPDDKYLWVIDSSGLKILKEKTPCRSARGEVCHTNITGGSRAFQAGEIWFCLDGAVCLNGKSGRYGFETLEQWNAVLSYFRYLGFHKIHEVNDIEI